jgi:hypothetical protein
MPFSFLGADMNPILCTTMFKPSPEFCCVLGQDRRRNNNPTNTWKASYHTPFEIRSSMHVVDCCKFMNTLFQTTYPSYVSETRIVIEVVIITAVVVGTVSIVYVVLEELIKAVGYRIWIAKIQKAIQ